MVKMLTCWVEVVVGMVDPGVAEVDCWVAVATEMVDG